ncbi:MAG: cyclic nucleotide-binding domain-containing protein [Deltaproteobacteria bacterium]|jgi:CRP-like cAMP-binding protein|nr:cyclic nucleotide-binding domain-containing protein [Deltaproteobacteria bacterium]MBW2492380.1 cyclic nucleotide-binding domain-containing protein [Deltaproteobacteria bacterium]
MIQKEFNIGDIIIEKGEPSDFVYKILSGEVEILKDHHGHTTILGIMKPEDYFGEMEVIEGQPRSVSVRAKTKVLVSVFEDREFFQLVSEDKSLSYRLIIRLCERLRAVSRPFVKTAFLKGIAEPFDGDSFANKFIDIDKEAGAEIQPTKMRLTLFPLSKQVASSLPEEGITITNMPFSVGRLSVKQEPKKHVFIDLKIKDSMPFRLSRMHFSFYLHSDGPGVMDLGSALGTEVNGELLGYNSSKDFALLKLGENKIIAGGIESPFIFKALLESD